MSGFERVIMGAVVGLCVGLIASLSGNAKLKKILKQCIAGPDCNDGFVYKGVTYSKGKYIAVASQEYRKTSKGNLKKMIKSYQKSFEKGKLNEIQVLDLEAMKIAFEQK